MFFCCTSVSIVKSKSNIVVCLPHPHDMLLHTTNQPQCACMNAISMYALAQVPGARDLRWGVGTMNNVWGREKKHSTTGCNDCNVYIQYDVCIDIDQCSKSLHFMGYRIEWNRTRFFICRFKLINGSERGSCIRTKAYKYAKGENTFTS